MTKLSPFIWSLFQKLPPIRTADFFPLRYVLFPKKSRKEEKEVSDILRWLLRRTRERGGRGKCEGNGLPFLADMCTGWRDLRVKDARLYNHVIGRRKWALEYLQALSLFLNTKTHPDARCKPFLTITKPVGLFLVLGRPYVIIAKNAQIPFYLCCSQ